jgi:hypothetical protein
MEGKALKKLRIDADVYVRKPYAKLMMRPYRE